MRPGSNFDHPVTSPSIDAGRALPRDGRDPLPGPHQGWAPAHRSCAHRRGRRIARRIRKRRKRSQRSSSRGRESGQEGARIPQQVWRVLCARSGPKPQSATSSRSELCSAARHAEATREQYAASVRASLRDPDLEVQRDDLVDACDSAFRGRSRMFPLLSCRVPPAPALTDLGTQLLRDTIDSRGLLICMPIRHEPSSVCGPSSVAVPLTLVLQERVGKTESFLRSDRRCVPTRSWSGVSCGS